MDEADGVRWQPALNGTLQLNRTNAFFLGGGKALVNAYYAIAASAWASTCRLRQPGAVDIDVRRRELRIVRSSSATAARHASKRRRSSSRPAASRRTSSGCARYGARREELPHPRHAVQPRRVAASACSTAAPRPSATRAGVPRRRLRRARAAVRRRHRHARRCRAVRHRRSTVHAQRFSDEGDDFWPKRYAIWGGLIARQPDQIVYCIVDAQGDRRLHAACIPADRGGHAFPSWRACSASTPRRWPARSTSTTPPCGRAPSITRSWTTATPKASSRRRATGRWRIDTPPFYAYPLRAGHHLHLPRRAVDERACVPARRRAVADNIFAAGEVMAGNILGTGLPGRVRHDDRQRLRAHRGRGGGAACPRLSRVRCPSSSRRRSAA